MTDSGSTHLAGSEASAPQDDPSAQRIQKLPLDVVNRIAAGEVIHRPASALKELLENALDAGSTSISVTVKEGGIKLLQVQDNGHGIREADLPILCERHTTSKLRAFEDLEGIGTLGFRGEALASITFVAHLTVTTMLHDGPLHALRATYLDGQMEAPAVPCAGVPGTTIMVEDLFYNVLTRKRALRNAAEEYARVLEVVGKYAIFKTGVSFTCKKHGETRLDVHTTTAGSRVDAVRAVHGAVAAKHLVPLQLSVGSMHGSGANASAAPREVEGLELDPEVAFTLDALVSSADYSAKKTTMVLFINDRLVDCPPLKRACEAVYATLLPKADKPYLFMNLHLPAQHVDVNTHPTKKEVSFLHSEQVVEAIQRALEAKLLASNTSRTFYTQTLLPGAAPVETEDHPITSHSKPSVGMIAEAGGGNTQRNKAGGDHKLVRIDTTNPQGSLEAYLCGPSNQEPQSRRRPRDEDPTDADSLVQTRAAARQRRTQAPTVSTCQLTSVQELCQSIDQNAHQELTGIFRHHVFVGMADDTLALIQHKTRLYLVQVPVVTKELVYQQTLRRFGAFGTIRLSNAAPLKDLLLLALDGEEVAGKWSESDGPKEEIATLGADLIQSKAPMLREYFAIEIDELGQLRTLPLILDQYTPDLTQLPAFALALANEVNWEVEKDCFDSMADALSSFYCVCKLKPGKTVVLGDSEERTTPLDVATTSTEEGVQIEGAADMWTVQHTLFPAARLFLQPPAKFAMNGTILQVACLEQLYKVFERC